MKKLILCADDYGYNQAVNNGIIKLVKTQRISAVSCLVNTPTQDNLKQLSNFSHQIDIGLHFNLTEPFKTSTTNTFSLAKLLIKAKTHHLKQQIIEQEFNLQLDLFEKNLCKKPDFIDGHQHIHQLPVVCDAILNVYAKRLSNKPYIRLVNFDILNFGKHFIISLASDFLFKQKLQKNNIPHNKTFDGIYNFKTKKPYRYLFVDFIKKHQDNTLIMTHPGLENNSGDSIASNRYNEFKYISSPDFLDDLEKYDVEICSF